MATKAAAGSASPHTCKGWGFGGMTTTPSKRAGWRKIKTLTPALTADARARMGLDAESLRRSRASKPRSVSYAARGPL